jgi:hypothetical protein
MTATGLVIVTIILTSSFGRGSATGQALPPIVASVASSQPIPKPDPASPPSDSPSASPTAVASPTRKPPARSSPPKSRPAPAAPPLIVDGNVTGTGLGRFEYDANWGLTTGLTDMHEGTANWSHVAAATATFRFTGTRVALHAVRDFDQGIMTVAVDGTTAQSIDNYAAGRSAAGIVWTSPVLASGAHSITIVNTGQHNGASSGINVAIDRADVSP